MIKMALRPVHTCIVCQVVTTASSLETACGQIERIEINYDTHPTWLDRVWADHSQSASTTHFFKKGFLNFDILIEKCNRNWSYVRK